MFEYLLLNICNQMFILVFQICCVEGTFISRCEVNMLDKLGSRRTGSRPLGRVSSLLYFLNKITCDL